MNFIRFTLAITFLFCSVSNSFSDELKELMLKQLNSTDFNSISNTYLDEYNSMILYDGQYSFMSKKEMSELLNSDIMKNAEKKINSYNIISRSETEDFVTVTYNYEYTAKIGNQKISGKAEGAGVFLKTEDGYISIFDAVTQ